MTDIETLLRETFAAHEDDVAQPLVARLEPRPSSHWMVTALGALGVAAAVAVTAFVSVRDDSTTAPGPSHSSRATVQPSPPDTGDANRQRAQDLAAHALVDVTRRVAEFPGGSRPVQPGEAGDLADLTAYLSENQYRVVQSSSWLTAVRDPSQVLEWFAQHPPQGLVTDGRPTYVQRAGETAREELTFAPTPSVGDVPVGEFVTSVLMQAVPTGKSVAFRATVFTSFNPARTPGQELGHHITDAEVTWGHQTVHVQDPTDLQRLGGSYAALVGARDLPRCGGYTRDRVSVTMSSLQRTMTATLDACGDWQVTGDDGAPAGPDLQDRGELLAVVRQLAFHGS